MIYDLQKLRDAPLPPGRARYAVLGHPITHSLSPAMQNAALRAAGIEADYIAIDCPEEAFGRRDRGAEAAKFQRLELHRAAQDQDGRLEGGGAGFPGGARRRREHRRAPG